MRPGEFMCLTIAAMTTKKCGRERSIFHYIDHFTPFTFARTHATYCTKWHPAPIGTPPFPWHPVGFQHHVPKINIQKVPQMSVGKIRL